MEAFLWLLLNILSIILLGLYSMGEMAIVSFNKIRLQYYVDEGSRSALWLAHLTSFPSRLFGTTLIGVNVSMMFGSEFAREFYSSIGIHPDWAPLTQVPLVIIIGELAPQFAARKFSENVSLLLAPFLYFSSKVLTPFVTILGWISKGANRLLGGKETHHELFLTLEELQKMLEEQEEDKVHGQSKDFDSLVANLFRLRNKTARKTMVPLQDTFTVSSSTTIQTLRTLLKQPEPFIPIYNKSPSNIIGIVKTRDLVRAPEGRKVRDYMSSPWFITENTSLLQILKQFRKSSETVACVLDPKGGMMGFISLDDLLDDIFGKSIPLPSKTKQFVDVTVPGSMTLEQFKKEFGVAIHETNCNTLSDLFLNHFEHHPEPGESLTYVPFDLIVKESSLMDIKTIQVRTRT